MSFVTIDDFTARYENTVPAADTSRVETLLGDACAIAMDIVGRTYADGVSVPRAIVTRVYEAVRRAYENPTGLAGETIGDYTWRTGYTGTSGSSNVGVYFTEAEKRIMRRAAGRSAASSIQLETNLADAVTADADLYLDVEPDGQPILYFDREDIP